MSTIPPYLSKGDAIGIVCPAGYMSFEKVEACINTLRHWSFEVKVGKTVGSKFNYFSGTDEERLEDLQQMLDDDSVKAVLCARGGYGLTRIIDKISFKQFRKHPKWLIGYSDVTVLHAHVYRQYRIASLHSPMAGAFNHGVYNNEYLQSVHDALVGKRMKYAAAPHDFNRPGRAKGTLVGGNLALLAHVTGTPSDVKTKNKILFLEDVGEYVYNVDRMMHQLKRSGKLDDLAGLIIGSFTEMKDTAVPFGKNVYEVIYDAVKEYDYPVCFGFPVGHVSENYALKIGVKHSLRIDDDGVVLKERRNEHNH